MTTTLEETIELYTSLNDEKKAKVLGYFSFDLTIAFRAVTLEEPVETQIERLKGINEIQHRAFAQMLAHLDGREQRYPDRDFFLILVKMGKASGLAGPVQIALMSSLKHYS